MAKPNQIKSFEDKLKELKAPIPLKWRVQSVLPNKQNPKYCVMISYIDARSVMERLDEVVGMSMWQSDYKEIKGVLYGGIGININGMWVWKYDAGTESMADKSKGESSDAFKRAAVKWGINRESYFIGTVKIDCKMYMDKPYPCDSSGTFVKGQKLYDLCNSKIKFEELENAGIEISDSLLADFEYGQSYSINDINDAKEKARLMEFIMDCKLSTNLRKAIGSDILEKYGLTDLYELQLSKLEENELTK